MADPKQPLIVSPAAMRRLAMRIGSPDAGPGGMESQLGLLPPPSPSRRRHGSGKSDTSGAIDGAWRMDGPKPSQKPWAELLGSTADLADSQQNSASVRKPSLHCACPSDAYRMPLTTVMISIASVLGLLAPRLVTLLLVKCSLVENWLLSILSIHHVTFPGAGCAGSDGLLVAAAVLDAPPRVTVEGPVDPPHVSLDGGPWYLRRDVQAEVGADHAVLRALGSYSGSLVEVVCLILTLTPNPNPNCNPDPAPNPNSNPNPVSNLNANPKPVPDINPNRNLNPKPPCLASHRGGKRRQQGVSFPRRESVTQDGLTNKHAQFQHPGDERSRCGIHVCCVTSSVTAGRSKRRRDRLHSAYLFSVHCRSATRRCRTLQCT